VEATGSVEASEVFSRIWSAFDTGLLVPSCAWCGRVRIDDTWVVPPRSVLAAVDQRYAFSHSICVGCAQAYARPAAEAVRILRRRG